MRSPFLVIAVLVFVAFGLAAHEEEPRELVDARKSRATR